MKAYAVVMRWEGVMSIHSSQEAAEAAIVIYRRKWTGDSFDVDEFIIDQRRPC